jgi:glyoxylase-like metal-dependent hydrolase (beta-lactamase superfamily II)
VKHVAVASGIVWAMAATAHYRVGSMEITALSDGYMQLDGGAVFGLVPRVMWEPVVGAAAIDADHRIQLGLNCLVVRSGDDVLMLETGMGNKLAGSMRDKVFPGDHGHLMDGLAAAGLRPEEITAVANTHLHADHCGWNTLRAGDGWAPTFPNARYLVQRGEYDACMRPNERTRATYFAENVEPLRATGQLELIEGEMKVTDEITVIPTHGHTRDHASVVLKSGSESAVYIGDMVQHPAQLERAPWVSSFDLYPLEAMETKKAVVGRAISEEQLVIAVHCEFPGLGRMTETADGKRKWTPVEPNG